MVIILSFPEIKTMKQLLTLLTIVAFLFTGCKKDSSSGNVTLKYEIVSSSAFTPVVIGGTQIGAPLSVTYTNETGQSQSEQINTNASSWSKTIELTATQRPIIISFITTAYTANSTGTSEVRIYVNGVIKANVIPQITPSPNAGGTFFGYLTHPLY